MKFPILTFLLEEVPAKISLLPESVRELLEARADLFGNLSVASEKNNRDILSLKTLKDCCLAEADGTLPTSFALFPKKAILFGGKFSTPKTSVFLKIGRGCSLSDVLEKKVPKK